MRVRQFKIVRGEMAKLEPHWATGTFLGRTDESDEVIAGTAVGIEFARSFRGGTRDKQWQREALTTFIGVPWNQEDWRWKLRWPAAGGGTSQSHLFNSTARRQAVQLAWEFHRSTLQRAEKDLNPNATDVIPVIPSVVGDPSPTGDVASTGQRQATQPARFQHGAHRINFHDGERERLGFVVE